MMRWLFAFLLLCNAVALAWQWDVFGRWGWGPNIHREPERLLQQVKPDAVSITLPPRPAASESAAPSPAPGLEASAASPAVAAQDAGSTPASPAASQALTTPPATPTAAPSSAPSTTPTPAAARSDAKAVR